MEQRFFLFDDNAEEDLAWIDLSQFEWVQRSGGSWEGLSGNARTWRGGEWVSISEPEGEAWLDNSLSFGNATYVRMAGATGTAVAARNVGNIISTTSNRLHPRMNPILLRNGSGFYRWNVNNSRTTYGRVYLRTTTPTSSDYGRRFISFLKDGVEQFTLSLFIHASSALGVLAYTRNGDLPQHEGGPVISGWGSIPHAQWTRLEFLVERPNRIRFRIYTDPHGSIPSRDMVYNLEDELIPDFDAIEINEHVGLFGMNRQDVAIQNFAIANNGWVGPDDGPSISLENSGANTVTNSTQVQLPITSVPAGTYVIFSALYTDTHGNTSVPAFTPPAGFQRLGFQYVGNSGSNVRSVLAVFGRYFSTADSSTKQISVGGGRSGRWCINQRHYTNVHPNHPIAAAWEGASNSNTTSLTRRITLADVENAEKGDVAYLAMICKADHVNNFPTSGAISESSANPATRTRPGGRSYNHASEGRRTSLSTDDQALTSLPSHPVGGFLVAKGEVTTTEAFGRVVLRRFKDLDEEPPVIPPYPLPGSLANPTVPQPPEPDPIFQTFTTTWQDTWNASFYGFGKRSGSNIYQGRVGSDTGNQHSYVGFNSANIISTLAGATINQVQVYLNNLHFYYNAGGTARIGTHNINNEPSNAPSGHRYHRTSINFNYGQAKWVTVPNSFGNDFRSGAARGITLGRPTSGTLADYGYFNGNSTQLRITYTRQVN